MRRDRTLKWLARQICGLIVGWLLLLALAVTAAGMGWIQLPDSVVQWVLGGTTASLCLPLVALVRSFNLPRRRRR